MSVRGGLGICERWCEVGGWAVVTVVRNVGTTVSPIVVLPRVVLKKKKRINKVGEVEGDWVVEDIWICTVLRSWADILPGGYCRFCGYCRFYN